MLNKEAFLEEFNRVGFCIVPNVVNTEFVDRAKRELEQAIQREAEYHKGKNYNDYGMVLLCPLYGGVFFDMLEHPGIIEPFHWVMGEGCIVYAQTSTSMPPEKGNYSSRIHVDSPRIIPNYVSTMLCLILLDDFTEENGATWFLPGSDQRVDPPSEKEFYAKARRLVAPAGTVLFWNPRIWHAGGKNLTNRWRHALTIAMCRPFMKQRIDIPRALSHMDLSRVSEKVLQKLGFFAQVPANYDEYYLPPEKRKYRQKAE